MAPRINNDRGQKCSYFLEASFDCFIDTLEGTNWRADKDFCRSSIPSAAEGRRSVIPTDLGFLDDSKLCRGSTVGGAEGLGFPLSGPGGRSDDLEDVWARVDARRLCLLDLFVSFDTDSLRL